MEAIKINNTILNFNKIIYVDAISGSDEVGNGSKENPYKTLQVAINGSNKGNAIKLAQGIYNLEGFNNLISVDNLSYIGDKNSIIEFNTRHTLDKNPTVSFYRIIFRPSKNFTSSKGLFQGGNSTKRSWNTYFYNCVFEDSFNKLIKNQRHSCYIVGDGSSSFEHDYKSCKFTNCIALDNTIFTSWNDSTTKTIEVKNCATNIDSLINPNNESDHSRNVKVTTSLTKASFDKSYNVTSEGWQNAGAGLNPNDTQAHIGVYGGEFGWGFVPQPINNISYNTNQKSVGDTILISWGESDSATRYELQYCFNNEWITINNNITNTEYAHKLTKQNPKAQYKIKGINEQSETKWITGETFEVANQSSIDGEIIISSQNRMRGNVPKIIGVGDSYIEGELGLKLPEKIFIDGKLELIKIPKENSIDAEMTVRVDQNNDIEGEIIIPPQNRMRGYSNIIVPEVHSYRFKPKHDTFVREQAPYVTYGQIHTMLSGDLNEDDKCISYIMFELEDIRKDIEIKDIYLKLTQLDNESYMTNINIYEIDTKWSEDWIKWVNKPELGKLITSKEVSAKNQVCKINLSDYYCNNVKNKSNVIALAIIADNPLTFGTKEYGEESPEFVVEYYELAVSGNQYSIDGEIIIRGEDCNEIAGDISVKSHYVTTGIQGELELKKNYASSEIEGDIVLTLSHDSMVDGTIELKKHEDKNEILGDAYIAYISDIDGDIELKKYEKDLSIDGEINVKARDENSIEGELKLKETDKSSDIDGEITLKEVSKDINIEGSIVLSKHNVIRQIPGELSLSKNTDQNSMHGQIDIIANEREYLPGELELKKYNKDLFIDGEINVNVPERIFMDGDLELAQHNESNSIDGELALIRESEIEIPAELELKEIKDKSNIDGEIILNKHKIQLEIEGDLLPGIMWAEEMQAELIVLRHDNNSEILGEIEVLIDEDDYVYIS